MIWAYIIPALLSLHCAVDALPSTPEAPKELYEEYDSIYSYIAEYGVLPEFYNLEDNPITSSDVLMTDYSTDNYLEKENLLRLSLTFSNRDYPKYVIPPKSFSEIADDSDSHDDISLDSKLTFGIAEFYDLPKNSMKIREYLMNIIDIKETYLALNEIGGILSELIVQYGISPRNIEKCLHYNTDSKEFFYLLGFHCAEATPLTSDPYSDFRTASFKSIIFFIKEVFASVNLTANKMDPFAGLDIINVITGEKTRFEDWYSEVSQSVVKESFYRDFRQAIERLVLQVREIDDESLFHPFSFTIMSKCIRMLSLSPHYLNGMINFFGFDNHNLEINRFSTHFTSETYSYSPISKLADLEISFPNENINHRITFDDLVLKITNIENEFSAHELDIMNKVLSKHKDFLIPIANSNDSKGANVYLVAPEKYSRLVMDPSSKRSIGTAFKNLFKKRGYKHAMKKYVKLLTALADLKKEGVDNVHLNAIILENGDFVAIASKKAYTTDRKDFSDIYNMLRFQFSLPDDLSIPFNMDVSEYFLFSPDEQEFLIKLLHGEYGLALENRMIKLDKISKPLTKLYPSYTYTDSNAEIIVDCGSLYPYELSNMFEDIGSVLPIQEKFINVNEETVSISTPLRLERDDFDTYFSIIKQFSKLNYVVIPSLQFDDTLKLILIQNRRNMKGMHMNRIESAVNKYSTLKGHQLTLLPEQVNVVLLTSTLFNNYSNNQSSYTKAFNILIQNLVKDLMIVQTLDDLESLYKINSLYIDSLSNSFEKYDINSLLGFIKVVDVCKSQWSQGVECQYYPYIFNSLKAETFKEFLDIMWTASDALSKDSY